jgi:hypothetical protein
MKTCNDCIHRADVRVPGQIIPVEICTINPPTVVMIPQPQGVALQGMQPTLPASRTCGQHETVSILSPE